jgi:DNA-binding MarR family transcriptional regulator
MKLSDSQIKRISELGRQFSDATILMHEAIARRVCLTGTDHKYLGLLMQYGAMTAGELAKRTGLTTGAVTGVIDRLEQKQLVKRAFDEHDRRKIVVVPHLDNAAKLLAPTSALLQSRMVELIASYTAEQQQLIEQYLHAALEVMNDFTQGLNQNKI